MSRACIADIHSSSSCASSVRSAESLIASEAIRSSSRTMSSCRARDAGERRHDLAVAHRARRGQPRDQTLPYARHHVVERRPGQGRPRPARAARRPSLAPAPRAPRRRREPAPSSRAGAHGRAAADRRASARACAVRAAPRPRPRRCRDRAARRLDRGALDGARATTGAPCTLRAGVAAGARRAARAAPNSDSWRVVIAARRCARPSAHHYATFLRTPTTRPSTRTSRERIGSIVSFSGCRRT